MRKRKTLRKAILLIPMTYNDGSVVPKKTLDAIEDELYIAFNGCTSEGEVVGSYRMRSGQKRVERLWRISVILEETELNDLRQMVARWGTILEQEVMYLEITDARIEFVSPNGRKT